MGIEKVMVRNDQKLSSGPKILNISDIISKILLFYISPHTNNWKQRSVQNEDDVA